MILTPQNHAVKLSKGEHTYYMVYNDHTIKDMVTKLGEVAKNPPFPFTFADIQSAANEMVVNYLERRLLHKLIKIVG